MRFRFDEMSMLRSLFATSCGHAQRCALSEVTREHYDVHDAVLSLSHLADSSTVVESRELIASAPALHSANILISTTLPNRLTTLNIDITFPDFSDVNDDSCHAMFERKRRDYRPHLHELEKQNEIAYRPMIRST